MAPTVNPSNLNTGLPRSLKPLEGVQAQGATARRAARALNDTFDVRIEARLNGASQGLQALGNQAEKFDFKELFGKVQNGLRWLVLGVDGGKFRTREELSDPDPRFANSAEMASARADLGTRKGAEDAAVARLGGARAESYRKLATLCEGDVPARQALMAMLLDGRLTKKDLKGQADLLSHLDRALSQPLATGVDRKELVTNLIEECENPHKLQQEGKGTCVATSMTIVLVRKNASDYARMVADLASPAGKTTTASGAPLERDSDWANDNDYGRTPSVKLLQPALMEHGNGMRRYDNDKDVHRAFEVPAEATGVWASVKRFIAKLPLGGGQGSWGATKIAEAVTGDQYSTIGFVGWPNRNSAWNRVKESLAKGHAVPVGISWEGGGHELVLDKVEGGFAYYSNPWGQTERMSEDEFKKRLCNASILKA